jgi:hypothetical protein
VHFVAVWNPVDGKPVTVFCYHRVALHWVPVTVYQLRLVIRKQLLLRS